MEQLLHYVWKHRLFPLGSLRTTDGREVEVIDVGLHNHHAGPDFFNAKVKIDGMLWAGNVEIHDKASDWYAHHHETDTAYNNVVLHVVGMNDGLVFNARGDRLPTLVLSVPQHVSDHYRELLATDHYPPCYRIIPDLSPIAVHAWMSALQTERLEQKTEAVKKRAERCGGSWEAAYFVTLSRNMGFGINGDAFEEWAMNIPLNSVDHHRDDLFQIETMFMGQAGLLETESVPARYREQAMKEGYFPKMQSEYAYLMRKFSMKPMDFKRWRFLPKRRKGHTS